MLLDLVQPFLRAAVSLDHAEISIPRYIVSITLHPARFGFFTGPSSIVPSLHWQKVWIFKLFAPLASFSFATWSSATFLASCSEPWTCGNFNTIIVSITLLPLGLGLFTAPSTIVPSYHRLKPSICKLFKPLASLSHATWSSATFLASCTEPWTCGNFNTLIVSITLQPARLEFFTALSTIVPSLHRLKVCICKLFTPLASFSYATWSSATFFCELLWALNLRKFQNNDSFYYIWGNCSEKSLGTVVILPLIHIGDLWL